MAEILQKIRQLMKDNGWNLYLLPRTNEHQSQYLAPIDQRVAFISGFTGSNAVALISEKEALLWTDGRYFLQAGYELYEGWQLRKQLQGQKTWFQVAIAEYPGATLGVDPKLLTAEGGEKRIATLQKAGLKVQLSTNNLADLVWTNKVQQQKPQIFLHQQWSGKSIEQKVEWVRNSIKQKQGKSAIFNDLSEIGWILNLRSSQIPQNPFFKGVLIVKLQGGSLYLPHDNPSLNSQVIKNHLSKVGISLLPYEPVFQQKALIQKSSLNYYIYNLIKDKQPIEWDGIGLYRSTRTQKQLNGFRRCHTVDGVAMAKFWTWRSKLDQIDQYEAALYMDNLRFQQQHNKGTSFTTICGGGPNAAIIHYHPTDKVHSLITKDMIHLLDSGGQYLDGTTDVTRTFHFGNPTPQQKDAFTRVLLGNLDIERMRWPAGKLNGGDVDLLARRHLWARGMDYQHGTGHGVGHFQGVHQGPVGIYKGCKTIFKAGMIVSNEPGYYQTGKFGIRIENMILVNQTDGWNWFQNLTLCPYDKNLIEKSLLGPVDTQFINAYHQRIWDILSPRLQGDHETLEWLKHATSPL